MLTMILLSAVAAPAPVPRELPWKEGDTGYLVENEGVVHVEVKRHAYDDYLIVEWEVPGDGPSPIPHPSTHSRAVWRGIPLHRTRPEAEAAYRTRR